MEIKTLFLAASSLLFVSCDRHEYTNNALTKKLDANDFTRLGDTDYYIIRKEDGGIWLFTHDRFSTSDLDEHNSYIEEKMVMIMRPPTNPTTSSQAE